MSELQTEAPYYVYTYAYPESMGGRVFYVGKGKGSRIDIHEAEARRGIVHNPHKIHVIKKIWSAQEQVQKNVLASFPTAQEAFLYEVALIFLLDGLTNLTAGGEGVTSQSEEARRKIKESWIKRAMVREDEYTIAASAKALKVSKDTIRRMIKRGELEAVRVGGQIRIKAASLQKYL